MGAATIGSVLLRIRRRRTSRFVAGLLLVVGVVVLATEPARLARVRESARIQRGPSVVARVVAVKVREVGARRPHHDTDYTVSFTNPRDGRTTQANVTRSFVNDRHGLNRSLPVSFDARDPSQVEVTGHPANTIRDWWSILALSIGFAVSGAAGLYLLRPERN